MIKSGKPGFPEIEWMITDISSVAGLKNAFDHIISVIDPGKDLYFTHWSHLKIQCMDVVNELCVWPPHISHIKEILEFSNKFKTGDKVLIHCHGGISRSTVVAIGLLVKFGYSPLMAISMVESLRPQMYPNELIAKLFDQALSRNDILKAVKKFQQQIQERDLIYNYE